MKEIKNLYYGVIVKDEEIEKKSTAADKMFITLRFEAGYYDMLNMLSAIQSNEVNPVIDSMFVADIDDSDKKSCGMSLAYYSVPKIFEHDQEEWIWTDVAQYGRANITDNDGVVRDEYWTTSYDFVSALRPISSDLPTVTMGVYGDEKHSTYIYADGNDTKKITLELSQDGTNYYYRYRSDMQRYPRVYDEWNVFVPENDFISLIYTSLEREDENDKADLMMEIINDTDKIVYANVYGDDLLRPRIQFNDAENLIIKNE